MTFLHWSANDHATNRIKNHRSYSCELLLIKIRAGSLARSTPYYLHITMKSLDLQERNRKISGVSTLIIIGLFVAIPAPGGEQLFEN